VKQPVLRDLLPTIETPLLIINGASGHGVVGSQRRRCTRSDRSAGRWLLMGRVAPTTLDVDSDWMRRAANPGMEIRKRRKAMRAMSATGFTGYGDLKLVDLPKPEVADGKVLVRVTAAGVTPLDHTILSGHYPKAKAPPVLGNEGAGTVEGGGGGAAFPAGSRVMFTGPYGVAENGTYSEWLAVRREHLCLIPDGVDDVSAAGVPVAYLTGQITLNRAGFQA
jgi:hypothetical protein